MSNTTSPATPATLGQIADGVNHGTESTYKWYGCRCQRCTRAASRADAERKLARLSGKPRSVPAGPITEHVKALQKRGLSNWQIAREARVQPNTVRRIGAGQVWVQSGTAEKILSVPLNVRVSAGMVPAVGAIRRVRALYALGHLNRVIVEESGISKDAVCALAAGTFTAIQVATDDAIRAAYDRLSMSTGTSWKTRKLAEANGWAPPLAWDDDTIDDPNAAPQTDAVQPVATEGGNVAARWLMGESVILGPDSRKEVLAHLYEWTNLTTDEIAAQLDLTPTNAEQIWNRMKKQARLEGKTLRRRVYVRRERDLKQNEMEEAA